MMIEPQPDHYGLDSNSIARLIARRRWLYRLATIVLYIMVIAGFFALFSSEGERLPGESMLWSLFGIAAMSIWCGLIVAGIIYVFFKSLELRIAFGPFRRLTLYENAQKAFKEYQERKRVEFWRHLSGTQFERELARLYRLNGYEVIETPPSGDGGIDLIISSAETPRQIVQCKRHSSPVGVGSARDLFGALTASRYDRAILASVSGFTRGTRQFCSGRPIDLLDLEQILEMAENAGK